MASSGEFQKAIQIALLWPLTSISTRLSFEELMPTRRRGKGEGGVSEKSVMMVSARTAVHSRVMQKT